MQGWGLQHIVKGPVTSTDARLVIGRDKGLNFHGDQNVDCRRLEFIFDAGICRISKRGFKADNAQPGVYIQRAGLWTICP